MNGSLKSMFVTILKINDKSLKCIEYISYLSERSAKKSTRIKRLIRKQVLYVWSLEKNVHKWLIPK